MHNHSDVMIYMLCKYNEGVELIKPMKIKQRSSLNQCIASLLQGLKPKKKHIHQLQVIQYEVKNQAGFNLPWVIASQITQEQP